MHKQAKQTLSAQKVHFRGWLSRLELVSSDKEEFCRLDRLLISIAVEGSNQPGPEQVCICPALRHTSHSASAHLVQLLCGQLAHILVDLQGS